MARCNKDCLNCIFERCLLDIQDRNEYVQDILKLKEKERHAEYYKKNKQIVDAKQRERDKKRDRTEYSHEFYIRHKKEINEQNKLRYLKNREERVRQANERYRKNRDEINRRRRELYRLKKEGKHDKHGENQSISGEPEKLVVGC